MQFFSPEYFWGLWILPVLTGIFLISDIIWKKRLSKIGAFSTLRSKLMPKYRPSERKFRAVLLLFVFLFSTLALARPQWGEEKKKIQRQGVDVLFLLDTSLSMMAEDAKPNRLEKAKREIKGILQELKGDRVGMITFSGSSFLQSPLTLDYSAFLLFLDAIKTGFIPDPGTSLSQALGLAVKAFPEKENKYKAVILLTDGEDNEGGVDETIKEVKKAGIRVYGICFGSPDGEPIPLKDENGRKTGVKKDRNGQVVITKANLPLLEKIATETGALGLPSTPAEQEIGIMLKHMASMGKRNYKEKEVADREDHYQLFLFLAMLFLIWEMLYSSTFKKIPVKALSLLILFFMTTGFLDNAQSLNEDGNKLYQEKKYQSALQKYQEAKAKDPENPTIRYNTGNALYQLNQYQEAAKDFEKASKTAKDTEIKEKALYNYGNSLYRLGQFEKAIDSYQKALEINPNDKDAKYNLEFLQKQKSMFDKKNNKQDNKQNKKQNQNNKDQQKNQDKNQQNQDNKDKNQQQNKDQNQQQNQNQQDQQQQNQNQSQQNQQKNQDQQKQDQKDQQQNQDQNKQDNQDQQKQDQQKQDQKDQQQNQDQNKQDKQDQQKQDQQKQDQKDQQQNQDQNKQDKQDQQKQDQQKQDQKDQEEKDKQQQDQQNQPQPEPQDQKQDQQEQQQPQDQQNQESNQPKPDQNQQQQTRQGGGKPLQGQMSMQNALQILEAMKESEKELQDLRRPPANKQPSQVDKDW